MAQELITQDQHAVFPGASTLPGAPGAMNVGAVAVEQQRAVAEAQGKMVLAKRFPRDENAAYAKLMDACKLPALANVAFYTVPRGGQKVTGPSIRLAEEIARVYGNFEYGHRELSRDDKKSEVEVFAWDVENNNVSRRQLTVMHVLDTRDGPRKLRDQKDIDDKIANVASKQLRGRILALMPKWMVEAAVEECRKTLAGNNDIPIADRVRKMTQAFAKFGVTPKHLDGFLGHSLDEVTSEEIADLQGVFNAIKDGAKISDYFGEAEEKEASTDTANKLTAAAQEGNQQRRQTSSKQQKKQTEQAPKQQVSSAEEQSPASDQEATAGTAPDAQSNSAETSSNNLKEPNAVNQEEAGQEEIGAEQQAAGSQSEDSDVF
jgi:hypothetical protein